MLSFTFQYKLIPNKSQSAQIDEWLEICRRVYNWNNCERKDWIKARKNNISSCSLIKEYIIPAEAKFPNYNIQAVNLTIAKKENPELKKVQSQVLQSTLKRLDKAWTDFFNKKQKRGLPRYKQSNQFRSFTYPQIKESVFEGNKVRLPKIGWIKFKKSREFPTGMIPKQLRVVKKAVGYFIQIIFVSTEDIPDIVPGMSSLGIDAGISSFIATSDGELIETPQFVKKAASKLQSLQRKLKHKIKGSSNWLKLQRMIAKLHFVVTSRRTDWLFKLAHQLYDKTDNIFVENLDFRGWQKGLFGKQINNSAIGKFINQILPFVCFKRGVYYQKVDKNYTSQICPQCATNTGKKSLNQRVHHCDCGAIMNRDIAAAKVIQQRGEIAVGHTVKEIACGGDATGVQLQLNLVGSH
ncbi:transposase [Hyella patelloides LEGE 07179]|uniref:Transposase n=1 Tax=Hyella patelloides LEGE 07179 TaxID=945734 RepID=A0A563VIP0_9CYAN|nr:RNA-guided endonuclease TnpB family protein [Hyella patelloides]VEP11294.1 transposase [Hyella patelloides LEGE 07179]